MWKSFVNLSSQHPIMTSKLWNSSLVNPLQYSYPSFRFESISHRFLCSGKCFFHMLHCSNEQSHTFYEYIYWVLRVSPYLSKLSCTLRNMVPTRESNRYISHLLPSVFSSHLFSPLFSPLSSPRTKPTYQWPGAERYHTGVETNLEYFPDPSLQLMYYFRASRVSVLLLKG